ncbi:MAG TPA: diguanylate cyclase [Bauldia sp.]|nr:diguanylate cyclase [Bauldia sp.]
MTTWHGLLANFAILAIFVTAWTQTSTAVSRLPIWQATVARAIIVAIGMVAVMSLRFSARPGIFIDLRTTMIVLAGFFGGPLAGFVAVAAAATYRIWLGGVGTPSALVTLAVALAVGLTARGLLPARPTPTRTVLILSCVAALASLTGFSLSRDAMRPEILLDVALPLATLTLLSVGVAGLAIAHDERRLQSERENRLYRTIIDALPDPLNAKDREGRFIVANPATARLLRAPDVAAVLGHTDFDFFPAETATAFRTEDEHALTGKANVVRQQLAFGDGRETWLASTKAPLRDESGNVVGVITHNRDISIRKHLEDEKEQLQKRFIDALANMADGLAMFDHDARIVMCNPQYAAMFPKTAHLRVAGADLRDILRVGIAAGEEQVPRGFDAEVWIEEVCRRLHQPGETEFQLDDGRWLEARVRPASDGTSLIVVSEITAAKRAEAALQASNEKLDRMARTDALTGLMNRRAFDDMLVREFLRSLRMNEPLSVLMCDVDHFKRYNDTYGHQQGDQCLADVAACLKGVLRRPSDLAARYGGEEFVALLPDTDAAGARALAETYRQAVRDLNIPHRTAEQRRVTISIGVATAPGSAIDSATMLIRRADEALYNSKAAGRDRVTDINETNLRLIAG